MKEKDFQSLFTVWAKRNWKKSAAFELKLTKLKSMPFNKVERHQLIALYDAKYLSMFHKISDMSVGYKPFDCFCLAGAEAYVVVMYYKKGDRKYCYLIDVTAFRAEEQKSKRKSLTEERAGEIGTKINLRN